MQEADLVAKMLRAVLQSHKHGVPFSRLQAEYKSLTGDLIPFRQLGHSNLEGYIKSIPGVVRVEISKAGEVTCRAVICQETAQIAQLVACQRTSQKKTGRQVNCSMRLKRAAPFASVGKPKGTLRKPGFMHFTDESRRPALPLLRSKGSCAVVRNNMNSAPYPLPLEFGTPLPKEVLNQGHMTVTNRLDRRATLPPRFQKELQGQLSKNVPVDFNENAKETRQLVPLQPPYPSNTDIYEIQRRVKEILNRCSHGICLSKLPYVYRETYREDLNTALLPQFENWPHVCVVGVSFYQSG